MYVNKLVRQCIYTLLVFGFIGTVLCNGTLQLVFLTSHANLCECLTYIIFHEKKTQI